MSFPVVKLPADRTCIVTGANTGVYFYMHKQLFVHFV